MQFTKDFLIRSTSCTSICTFPLCRRPSLSFRQNFLFSLFLASLFWLALHRRSSNNECLLSYSSYSKLQILIVVSLGRGHYSSIVTHFISTMTYMSLSFHKATRIFLLYLFLFPFRLGPPWDRGKEKPYRQ